MEKAMSGQGYHLALDEQQVNRLLSFTDEIDIVDYASHTLEGFWADHDTTHLEGGEKDWNILLLCLTDGTYDPRGGTYPLNGCFFGGRLLVREGSIVNVVMPGQVRDVAEALAGLDRKELRARYMRLPLDEAPGDDWAKDEEHLYDLYVRMVKLRRFYQRAAREGRAVMFYTDDSLDYFFKPNDRPENDAAFDDQSHP
jgi:Domain of unknown function (DUF1877)